MGQFTTFGFKEITIQDNEIFFPIFKSTHPEISEYTFSNLFMWRNYYKFEWKRINNTINLISCKDPEKIYAFPPIGNDIQKAIDELLLISKESKKPLEFHRVPKSMLENISNYLPKDKKIEVIEDRNNWDYVYETQSLINLAGQDFFNIRKKLNKVKREHPYNIVRLNPDTIKDCLNLQEEWCNIRHCDENPSLKNEDLAIKELFNNWSILKFDGIVITIQDKIQAYSLGEPLNPDTFVTHIEKANPEMFGLYQAINQAFAETLAKDFKYINREQDLGEEGLRNAKTNYHPVKMIEKYIIKI